MPFREIRKEGIGIRSTSILCCNPLSSTHLATVSANVTWDAAQFRHLAVAQDGVIPSGDIEFWAASVAAARLLIACMGTDAGRQPRDLDHASQTTSWCYERRQSASLARKSGVGVIGEQAGTPCPLGSPELWGNKVLPAQHRLPFRFATALFSCVFSTTNPPSKGLQYSYTILEFLLRDTRMTPSQLLQQIFIFVALPTEPHSARGSLYDVEKKGTRPGVCSNKEKYKSYFAHILLRSICRRRFAAAWGF